ncbi:hypothetical protein B1526_1687 [Bifidobacterium criceti]|uniref:Uncharacterized protein n=1 Tax=Bifidobacterium criceti TaxID=1960969 RepID=A0A2A2ED18_9BIFI|nr:hypothetical protein B1526_1687 [Bifidobacterium criceti]
MHHTVQMRRAVARYVRTRDGGAASASFDAARCGGGGRVRCVCVVRCRGLRGGRTLGWRTRRAMPGLRYRATLGRCQRRVVPRYVVTSDVGMPPASRGAAMCGGGGHGRCVRVVRCRGICGHATVTRHRCRAVPQFWVTRDAGMPSASCGPAGCADARRWRAAGAARCRGVRWRATVAWRLRLRCRDLRGSADAGPASASCGATVGADPRR